MKQGLNLIPIAIGLLVLGCFAIGGLYFFQSSKDDAAAGSTSDRGKIASNIKVGGDPWIGYMPLASTKNKTNLRRKGITLQYLSDGGDYQKRMQQVRDGKLDMAVVTVDANLLNTPDFNRGGVIVAVIDQSSGGDAMVCDASEISSVGDFTLKTEWKVAFTPNSPSHHLLRAMGNDFGIDAFLQDRGSWRVESDGSSDALEKFKSGSVDCAVLWQPDVVRALQGSNNKKVIFSSADADKLIVDVLIVHRKHLLPSSKMRPYIEMVIDEYFKTLHVLTGDEALLLKEAKSYLRTFDGGKYTNAEIQSMLDGVTWVNLKENGESWFGIGGDSPYYGLNQAHDFALSIIRGEKGKGYEKLFRPESITDSSFIKTLYERSSINEKNSTVTDPLKLRFPSLSELEWNTLSTQGALRSRRIVFTPGSLKLDDSSVRAIGEAMNDFKRYPKSRLEVQVGYIVGSTESANLEAKKSATIRAEAVHNYLVSTYDLDPNRLRVYVPEPQYVATVIPQADDEGGRAYRSRLREARLVLRRSVNN